MIHSSTLQFRASKTCTAIAGIAQSFLCATMLLAGDIQLGEQIYRDQCIRCHGELGVGVPDEYEETLYGNRSLEELTKIVHETMPDEHADKCVDQQATQVATYIYDTFYTEQARAKHAPPRRQLSRLTVSQYSNVVADLLADFRGRATMPSERGLRGEYFNSRSHSSNKRVIDRTDNGVSFDFKAGSPQPGKIGDKEFAARWSGSLIADETGDYEIIVSSENGYRLWLNDNDSPLIDRWVSSGDKYDAVVNIRLLAGRAYPLRLDFFKFKDKSASIELTWTPPNKAREVIPKRHLSPRVIPATFVVQTPFPADDASAGYPRGIAVSAGWDAATTQAALEVADFVVADLSQLSRSREGDKDRTQKLKDFCYRFVERAIRRPLQDHHRTFFVDEQFDKADSQEEAVKRVVLLTLKSPQFLYLGLNEQSVAAQNNSYVIAERLAFALWDSLPDQTLLNLCAQNQLTNPNIVNSHANRMLRDQRARNKFREFAHRWLGFEHADRVDKDRKVFPDFDDSLIADLRTSLDLLVRDVVWSDKSDFRQLLAGDQYFMNARLAEFYDVQKLEGDEFQSVAMKDEPRSGVVTHPYLLASLSYPHATSPIHRGVFAARHLLGRALKPPPIAVEFKEADFSPELSRREKIAKLTADKSCQTCHHIINPVGFSFEHFDAVGRFRNDEAGKPIDAKGNYPQSDGTDVSVTGVPDIVKLAIQSSEAQDYFVSQLFLHMVKQPPAAYGPKTVETLRNHFVNAEFSIQSLMVEIAKIVATEAS